MLIISILLLAACGNNTSYNYNDNTGKEKTQETTKTTTNDNSWCRKGTTDIAGFHTEILGVETITLDNGRISCVSCHTKDDYNEVWRSQDGSCDKAVIGGTSTSEHWVEGSQECWRALDENNVEASKSCQAK